MRSPFFLETLLHFLSYIYMQVVTTDQVNDQFIYFIPRSSTVDKMYLTDESTNIEVEVIITTYTPGDYTDEIEAVFNCREGHYYRMVLKDVAGVEVYRDRLFCTNQVPANYTPNSSTYTAVQSANTFLMY